MVFWSLNSNKAVMNKYLLSVFVRLFLEKKEKALMKFISEFQKLTLSDEKVSRGCSLALPQFFVIWTKIARNCIVSYLVI